MSDEKERTAQVTFSDGRKATIKGTTAQIKSAVDEYESNLAPNFPKRATKAVGERFGEEQLGPALSNKMEIGGVQTNIPDMTSNALQLGGQVAKSAWDVLGEAISGAVDTASDVPHAGDAFNNLKQVAAPALKAYADSDIGQWVGDKVFAGLDSYEGWADENPKEARNVDAAANVALLIAPVKGLPASRNSGSMLQWLDRANPIKPKTLETGGPMTKKVRVSPRVSFPAQQVRGVVGAPSQSLRTVGTALKKSGVKKSVAKKEAFVQKLIEPANPAKDISRVDRTVQKKGVLGRLVTEPSQFEAAAAKETMKVRVSPRVSFTENARRIKEKISRFGESLVKGLKMEARLGRIERAKAKPKIDKKFGFFEEPPGVPRGHYALPEMQEFLALSSEQAKLAPFAVGSEKAIERVYETFFKILSDKPIGTLEDLMKARIRLDQTYAVSFDKLKKKQAGAVQNEAAIDDAVTQLRSDINSFLADRAGSVSIKDLLHRQSALYTARDVVRLKARDEARNRILRFLSTATKQMALRDTSLQWVSAGMLLGSAATAPWFGSVALGLGIPGVTILGGKVIMSAAARKAMGKLILATDKAIKMTTDPHILKQIRADRAAIIELIQSAEIIPEGDK